MNDATVSGLSDNETRRSSGGRDVDSCILITDDSYRHTETKYANKLTLKPAFLFQCLSDEYT